MKRKLALLLLVALLLTGCGQERAQPEGQESLAPAETPETAEPETPEAEEPETPEAEEPEAPETEETETPEAGEPETPEAEEPEKPEAEEPGTLEAAEPTDPIAVKAERFSPEKVWITLRETEEFRLELAFARDYESGKVKAVCRAESFCGEDIEIDITDVVLNGDVQVGQGKAISLSPGERKYDRSWHELDMSCAWIGYENVTELRALVSEYKGRALVGEAEAVTVRFPEGIRPTCSYESFRGMRADRQVLISEEKVTVALLACGSFLADSENYYLKGLVWAENRGDKAIPVAVSNLSLNGVSIPVLGGRMRELEPGNRCIVEFQAYTGDMDTAGITAIEAMSLQILTSQEENSAGAFGVEGGDWVPVALAESAAPQERAEQGELVYDDGMLRLSLERTELRSDRRGDRIYVSYTVHVLNRRAEGVSLRLSDPMVEGEPYQNVFFGYAYVDVSNRQFGPRSEGYMVLTLYFTPEEVGDRAPTFSFLLQVLSQGEDSIFYSIPERIQLSRTTETEEETP